eukprot:g29068.t1
MFAVGDWRDAEKDKVKPTRTGFVDAIKVEQHDELIRRLRAARFRFIDKGDVGVHRWTASGSRVRECKAICNAVSHGDSNPKIVVP